MDIKQLFLYLVSALLFVIVAFVISYVIKLFMRRKALVYASLPTLEEVRREELSKKMNKTKEAYTYNVNEPDLKEINEVSEEPNKYINETAETSIKKDFGGEITEKGSIKAEVKINVGESVDLPEL